MAKVLVDTNVLIDYLSSSRPEHEGAVELFDEAFIEGDIDICVAANSLIDAYYILVKTYRNERIVRERLAGLHAVVTTVYPSDELFGEAFLSNEPDLEDAVVRVSAEYVNAEAIITRDKVAFKDSRIKPMLPRAYLDQISDASAS